MRRGSITHGDHLPIRLGCFRPDQECSRTNTPIPALYTAGASNHPGGGVPGAGGHIGATRVAEDLGVLTVLTGCKPTAEMETHVATYLE